MNIEERLLTINPYSRPGTKLTAVKQIVVHWVGNANSSAIANRNYFENLKNQKPNISNGYRYASSQYIVDLKGEIIRCIPENEVAYHAGNGTVNRNSIGIETCHPDWNGKFSDATYTSLVELCADICRRYNLTAVNIIRHYDVTGKVCPKYYVENADAWLQFKRDVAKRIGQASVVLEEKKGSDEEVRVYQNGSTKETVYSDTNCSIKLGSLSPHERCDCLGVFNGKAMVRYQVGSTGNYKIGFCNWLGGVK